MSRADPRGAPLDGMALFEVYQPWKVSLDKCSHQESAYWHQYGLARCALQQGITPSWRRPLRSDGVPLVLGGCHMCQEGCPMMRHLLGHLHEHGITLGVPPNGWEAPHHCARDTSTVFRRGTPCGRAHCARHTAANVHSLDGYTCQGTPSLMDGPQIKQTISSGATSSCMEAPASAVELSRLSRLSSCRA